MAVIFPPLEKADADGLLAISQHLNTEMLIAAYKSGIFPGLMRKIIFSGSLRQNELFWGFIKLIIPRRLRRHINNSNYEFTVNTAFPKVIRSCALTKRPNQQGTWITQKIIDAYIKLHKAFIFSRNWTGIPFKVSPAYNIPIQTIQIKYTQHWLQCINHLRFGHMPES